MRRPARLIVFAVLCIPLASGCDFGAAREALDEIEGVAELPPLKTVVNLQVLDASNGAPITRSVQVTFGGPDASEVIDVYNDPISEMTIENGFANFGLDSTWSPTSNNLAELELRASASGYVATSVSIGIRQEGSVSRVIRLRPENPESSVPGTSGDRRNVDTNEEGETTSLVTAETGRTSDEPDAAEAAASVPPGTRLRTPSGDPLQGPVTMDLSVYDNSADAQALLPSGVKANEEGQRRQIHGAVRFGARDNDGRVAGQFGEAGQDTTTVTATLPTPSADNGAPTITLVNPETGDARTVNLGASGVSQTVRAKQNHQQTTFLFAGSEVVVKSPAGTTVIDRSGFSGEFFAAVGVEPTGENSCTPESIIETHPNGQKGTVALRLSGNGVSADTQVPIPNSNSAFPVAASTLFGQDIPALGDLDLTLRTPGEQKVATTINPCSGTYFVKLPVPAQNRIDATIRASPDCPAGQSIPLSPPLSGYTIFYRPVGSDRPYRTVPNEEIRINPTDNKPGKLKDAVVSVSGVLPNTDYKFIGTFGDESASREITMPVQEGEDLEVSDERLQSLCR